jgi:hypothetical protein
MEKWKPLSDFPGYSISSFGRIRSEDRWVEYRKGKGGQTFKKGKMLSTVMNSSGYLQVHLWNSNQRKAPYVHRLVLENFGPPQPSEDHEANHKNCVKTDNVIENLEWVTHSENAIHGVQNGKWHTEKCKAYHQRRRRNHA